MGYPLTKDTGLIKPGVFIFEFFQNYNITFDTKDILLERFQLLVTELSASEFELGNRLEILLTFLNRVFNAESKAGALAQASHYRVYIEEAISDVAYVISSSIDYLL